MRTFTMPISLLNIHTQNNYQTQNNPTGKENIHCKYFFGAFFPESIDDGDADDALKYALSSSLPDHEQSILADWFN